MPDLLRQNPAGSSHGRWPAQHPDGAGDRRLPGFRDDRRRARGHRRPVLGIRRRRPRQAGPVQDGRVERAGDPRPGVCAGMATANTMHCVVEALGMCVPGSAPVRANGWKRCSMPRAAPERGSLPWSTRASRRARCSPRLPFATPLPWCWRAVSGSINAIKHLQRHRRRGWYAGRYLRAMGGDGPRSSGPAEEQSATAAFVSSSSRTPAVPEPCSSDSPPCWILRP